MVKIIDDLEIVDLALKYKDVLIIGDLHIGYEDYLLNKGIFIPRFQFDDLVKRLNNILEKVKPKIIVINGDLKHEFGTISEQEWNDTLRMLDLLGENREIILIRGNHDTILGPIAEKRNIKIVDRYDIDNITILHGNKLFNDLNKIVIIGHLHPTISFKEKPSEKYECFLKGKYKKYDLIIMPAIGTISYGFNITKEIPIEAHNPYFKNLKNFEVYVVQDKVYKFGKLKNLI